MPESTVTTGYGNRVIYFAIVMSLAFLFLIINLVRKRQLSERFALAWLAIPLLLLVFSSNRSLLEWLAEIVGIYYAPAIMIPIMFGLFILVSLYFSVKVSNAERRIKDLAQELALLRYTVEKPKKNKL